MVECALRDARVQRAVTGERCEHTPFDSRTRSSFRCERACARVILTVTVRHVRAAVTAELLVRAASGDELAGDSGAGGRSLRAGAATSDISVRAAPPPLTVPVVVGGVYTTLYLSY